MVVMVVVVGWMVVVVMMVVVGRLTRTKATINFINFFRM
jgi:hypothetical protein